MYVVFAVVALSLRLACQWFVLLATCYGAYSASATQAKYNNYLPELVIFFIIHVHCSFWELLEKINTSEK